jgi:hypothetical protein
MSLPWVADSDLLWDTLILGGDVWPGIPTVESETSRAVDAQKKAGDDGANLVDQGYEPAKVKITIRIWLREQWEQLQTLLAKVHPRNKGGVRTPVDIAHPETQLKGVRQVYVQHIGAAVPGRGAETGTLTLSIDCIEWFPAPKPAKSNTKKSKSSTGGDLPTNVNPPNATGGAEAFV